MNRTSNIISNTFLILVIIGTGYYFREDWKNLFFPFEPCRKAVTYSLGTFDERFGISKEEFLENIIQAEEIWEDEVNKPLFQYSPNGVMKVHLIYDNRQETTDRLKEVGIVISDDKASYDRIKMKYDLYVSELEQKQRDYNRRVAAYEKDLEVHDKRVDYLNENGGAPKDEYQELKAEEERLNNEATKINALASSINSLTKDINGIAAILNDLANKLNIQVKDFNTIGESAGEEFNEGEYIRDDEGIRINVYQFENEDKLLRLLQHELGHAIGLDHVDNPQAIMYRLNSSTNGTLTTEDVTELLRICKN